MRLIHTITTGFAAVLLLGASTAAAAPPETLEQRLRELEKAYTDLIVRDREKDQEIGKLRGEISALKQGKRTGASPSAAKDAHGHTDTHGHAHAEKQVKGTAAQSKESGHEHDHGHDAADGHDDHGHGANDVLMETEHVRLYMPSFGLDLVGYKDDSDPVLEERLETLNGFGGHAHDEGEDGHGVLGDGFNLRHAEVGFAMEAIGFGRAQVLINGSSDGIELEEAFVKTDPILDTASFKGGKFRSNFGFFNASHSPEWKFADMPLAHFLIFGDHGLEGTGAQAELSVPQFPVQLGVEGFQGGGETIFTQNEGAGDVDEPSVFVGWLKAQPYQRDGHRVEVGFSGGIGRQQEEHDEGGDEEFFKGDAWFISPGFAYMRKGKGSHGEGDISVKGEYIYRVKDLSNIENGEPLESHQDGYYIQAAYGFAPRFEAGLRWEQVGLINDMTEGSDSESFGDSWRVSSFFAFKPVPGSTVGVQANYGSYDFNTGRDDVFQAMARLTFRYGPHFH